MDLVEYLEQCGVGTGGYLDTCVHVGLAKWYPRAKSSSVHPVTLRNDETTEQYACWPSTLWNHLLETAGLHLLLAFKYALRWLHLALDRVIPAPKDPTLKPLLQSYSS